MKKKANLTVLLIQSVLLAGCDSGSVHEAIPSAVNQQQETSASAVDGLPCEPSVQPENRQIVFGELHLHTSLSYDAKLSGNYQTTPDQAYRFAKGETIEYFGHKIRRKTPLDFAVVTDHAEYLGVLNELDNPASPMSLSELGRRWINNPKDIGVELRKLRGSGAPYSPEAFAVVNTAWASSVRATNKHYEPCEFVTLIGFEWTLMADGLYNLHRNVIFESDSAPAPFGSNNGRRPEDLWTYMETARRDGFDSIAITHNGNASNGLMYDIVDSEGKPITAAYANRRMTNEPLAEIAQTKGQSETVPALSPNDEFADFEIFGRLLIGAEPGKSDGSFLRHALVRGLDIEQRTGVNPYQVGFVGGTDFHNGISTQKESAYEGNQEGIDPESMPANIGLAQKLVAGEEINQAGDVKRDPRINSGGTLTGIWTDGLDRKSIFAALKRKETFATSGPRMRLRLFGGWDYSSTMVGDSGWVSEAYMKGVPMGGTLFNAPAGAAPTLIVQAARDPEDANLDRIQIIKQVVSDGVYLESIFDVALGGANRTDAETGDVLPVGNTVDAATGTYENTIGSAHLQAVWTDPDFNPAQPAVYYARVLQIPTPRWTTILAARAGVPPSESDRLSIQERGWSSPIWYKPVEADK